MADSPLVATVARTAAWVLPDARRREITTVDTDAFLAIVQHQRVSGLVWEAARAHGVLDHWDDDVLERLAAVHLDALRSSLAAEAASVEVSDVLRTAGIGHAILKGCATCQLDYPDPAMRITGDVDVLVARDDHAETLEVLGRAGYHRIQPPFRTGWERRYGEDIALLGTSRVEIDVHLALVAGYFGIVVPTERLLDRLDTYRIAGRTVPALDATGRLLHAAIHTAAATPLRLGSAADIVQIAGAGGVGVDDVAGRATELGCDGLVARGVQLAWDLFDIEPSELAEWARAHRCDDRQASALAALTRPGGETRWLSGLAALPWWRRPGYVAPLLWPSRDHLDARGRTRHDHLRISLRRLRR